MDLLELRVADLDELGAAAMRLVAADTNRGQLEAIGDLLTSRVVTLIRTGTFAELSAGAATIAALNGRSSLLRSISLRAANRIEQLLPVLTAAMAPDAPGALPMVLQSVGPRGSELLAALAENPASPTPRSSLRKRLQMDEGNLSRMLGQLEQAGIVERIASNRREVSVMLTSTGRATAGCELNQGDSDMDKWLAAMIDCRYLVLVPNDLCVNPVISDMRDPLLGTNIVIDSEAWLDDITDGVIAAGRLLREAARLLVGALPPGVSPTKFVPLTVDTAGQPSSPEVSLAREVNYPPLLLKLAEACESVAAQDAGRREKAGTRRPVGVLLQDAGMAGRGSTHVRASLLGFERKSSITLQSLSPGPSSAAFRDLLERRTNDRKLREARSSSFARFRTPSRRDRTPRLRGHSNRDRHSGDDSRGFHAVLASIDRIAEGVGSSGAILAGVYVQPTPGVDDRWVNLEGLSKYLREKKLVVDVHRAFDWTVESLVRANRTTSLAIYDVCQADSHTADKRFDGLEGWQPGGAKPRRASFDESWSFIAPDPGADICIVSCVSNNWTTYQELALRLARPGQRTGFVSLLGPTQNVGIEFLEDHHNSFVEFLPLLVWNTTSKVFEAGPRTERFGAAWNTLARHS